MNLCETIKQIKQIIDVSKKGGVTFFKNLSEEEKADYEKLATVCADFVDEADLIFFDHFLKDWHESKKQQEQQ